MAKTSGNLRGNSVNASSTKSITEKLKENIAKQVESAAVAPSKKYTVQSKLDEIKEASGLDLSPTSSKVTKRGNLSFITVEMRNPNVSNPDVAKLERLKKYSIVERVEPAGRNQIAIWFKQG